MAKGSKLMQTMLHLANLRFASNNRGLINAAVGKRNKLFEEEQKRQRQLVGPEEKIEVRYVGLPVDATLVMSRNVSTPYDCAQHLSEVHSKRSGLALIDRQSPWDMHRPLTQSCTLQLLNFTAADPLEINNAFWRTCSFILGAAVQNLFTEEARLQLHSFPAPDIKSGSFVYDVILGTQKWEPTKPELRSLSLEMANIAGRDLKFEHLEVDRELALQIFEDARYKREQLPSIAQKNQGRVTLYRIGRHIDISQGPMLASTRFLGKCSVAAVHKLANEGEADALFRIQGVGLPAGFTVREAAFRSVEERAKKLNPARHPNEPMEETQKHRFA